MYNYYRKIMLITPSVLPYIVVLVTYKLKRCIKKECCKQCRYVKFKGTMTKWPVQNLTHRTTQNTYHHDATDILKKKIIFFIYIFLNELSKMLSYRLGTVNDFHWGFKHVLILQVYYLIVFICTLFCFLC